MVASRQKIIIIMEIALHSHKLVYNTAMQFFVPRNPEPIIVPL